MNVRFGSFNKVIKKRGAKTLTGILCTFDTLRSDAEMKRLIVGNKEMCRLHISSSAVDNDLSD